MSGATIDRRHLFINRELSWLAFNERVLEEAEDCATPLLERVKFAAIAASNLDEFFMVRVAGLEHAIDAGESAPDAAGMSPTVQLQAVRERTHLFMARLYRLCTETLFPELASHGIRMYAVDALAEHQRAAVAANFRERVLPVLTPLAIDISRPFPLLASLTVNLALLLEPAPGDDRPRLAIVQVPPAYPRLVPLAGEGAGFVLLEEIIRTHVGQLFPGQKIVESAAIRLARDAEMELDDEGGHTHLEVVERELRRRRSNDVIRFEVEASISEQLLSLLCAQLEVTREDVYTVPGPLDLRVLMGLVDVPGREELRDPPHVPVHVLADEQQTDIFAVLDRQHVLLHHPYDAYDPVVALIAQAADDPQVLAIKQTLYRTSVGSPIIAALQRAAEANKQVTVLVELTARFDEERNIRWARALEEAGAHVIYGVIGYKTHAKICLIVRRTEQGLRRYVHLGTGNYNERTARLYTDFGLMTSSPAIGEDASAVFSALTGYSDPPKLRKLVMAPTDLRRKFVRLIGRERRRAESGQPAEIVAQMNSLLDEPIIEELYAAAAAGVRIQLAVRGICALRPGIAGVSDNLEVVSIVARFLEHARVYYFLNNGEEEVYLSSADWMKRNLDRRIELMFPVEDPGHKAAVIHALRSMFRDNVKARVLRPDGTYERKTPGPGEPLCRVQMQLQEVAERRAEGARARAGVTFRPARA